MNRHVKFVYLGQSAQHVQRKNVPGTFPDGVQRSLPVQPRHGEVFHVAVASQTLQSFVGDQRVLLADEVFGHLVWCREY